MARAHASSAAPGTITTYAGVLPSGYSGDGGPATAAQLRSQAQGVITDASGNLFITDRGNSVIRRVDRGTGIITTYAGNGLGCGDDEPGFCGDGGPALSAGLRFPVAVAFDTSGNLIIATERTLHRVDKNTGLIKVIAGGQGQPDTGMTGPALGVNLTEIGTVAADAVGNLYLTGAAKHNAARVRKIDSSGFTTVLAGTGTQGFSGDGGPAALAQVGDLGSITVDSSGNVFFVDIGNRRVRRIDKGTGVITTVAGGGTLGDGALATQASLLPNGVVVDAGGNLFISDDGPCEVHRVDAVTKIITQVAGGPPNAGCVTAGDGGPATMAGLSAPGALALDPFGNLFISTQDQIRRVEAATTITTAPLFTADTPPAATVGTGYSYTFAASGSPAPTFALASGALPAGLTLNATGVLSGTPTTPGSFTFTVRSTNGVSPDAVSPSITITVATTANRSVTVTHLNCNSAATHVHRPLGCGVSVSTLRGGPVTPATGTVLLATNVGPHHGAFSDLGTCSLVTVDQRTARCSFTYTPNLPENTKIYANYPGDATHAPSHASLAIRVLP